jgi:hypothetical protein
MMMQPQTPTRSEIRLVELAAEANAPLSFALVRLVGLARLGWLDGQTLFDQLNRQGLAPEWVRRNLSPAIRVVDPVAGQVVLHCETAVVTIH